MVGRTRVSRGGRFLNLTPVGCDPCGKGDFADVIEDLETRNDPGGMS